MKKTLFTAALLFTCTLAFNQTRLSGRVIDETKEPLIGATVKLLKGGIFSKGVITDFDGNFTFQSLEPGVYDLEVLYTGFQTKRVEKVDLKTNTVQTVNVVMEATDYCCDCMVYRYFYPQLIDQNPGNTGVIYSANFFRHMY